MAGQAGTFDADQAPFAGDNPIPAKFKVADKEFLVRRSGWALMEIIKLNPDGAELSEEERKANPTKEIEELYKMISFVLVDPADASAGDPTVGHPDSAWLSGVLDFIVAQEFVGKIMPEREDREAIRPPALRPVETGAQARDPSEDPIPAIPLDTETSANNKKSEEAVPTATGESQTNSGDAPPVAETPAPTTTA